MTAIVHNEVSHEVNRATNDAYYATHPTSMMPSTGYVGNRCYWWIRSKIIRYVWDKELARGVEIAEKEKAAQNFNPSGFGDYLKKRGYCICDGPDFCGWWCYSWCYIWFCYVAGYKRGYQHTHFTNPAVANPQRTAQMF